MGHGAFDANRVFAVHEVLVRIDKEGDVAVGCAAGFPFVQEDSGIFVDALKEKQHMVTRRAFKSLLIDILPVRETGARTAALRVRPALFMDHGVVRKRDGFAVAGPIIHKCCFSHTEIPP